MEEKEKLLKTLQELNQTIKECQNVTDDIQQTLEEHKQDEIKRKKQERNNLIFNIIQYTFSLRRDSIHSINRILVLMFYWIFRIVMLSFLFFFIVQINVF